MALRFLIGTKSCFKPLSFIRQTGSLIRNISEGETPERTDYDMDEEITFPHSVMNCLNEVRLIGRIYGEPRETQIFDQSPCVIAPLTTEYYYRNTAGATMRSVVYHKIIFRNKELANFVLNHVTKGSRVHILGSITNVKFCGGDDNSGDDYVTCVRADRLIPLTRLNRKKSFEIEYNN